MTVSRNLIEKPTDMILGYIKSNIASALADTRNERSNQKVTTEPPNSNSYYVYEGAIAYVAPAVFVVPSKVQSLLDRGQNFISSQARFVISVVVQDREMELLSRKAWRYQDALHDILHLKEIEDVVTQPGTKLQIKVVEQRFSENFSAPTEGGQEKAFRKEVALDCDVEIYQGL